MVLSGYRKSDYHDPKAFMTQAAMNLARFTSEVVEYVTNPTTGIQTRCKWPPSLAELVEACNAENAYRVKVAAYAELRAIPRLPPPKFSIADSYDEMFKKYGRPNGPFERDGKWGKRELPYGD